MIGDVFASEQNAPAQGYQIFNGPSVGHSRNSSIGEVT
jgi:hypothetical protein